MEPQITTVIPTYRRPKLLRRAIQSVLNQTYPHFEVHVWDNASGDETPDVVAEIARRDPRVKYHCNDKNIGLASNFALGVRNVATPVFSLLSDDDVLLPRFFEEGMRSLDSQPGAGAFAGVSLRSDPAGRLYVSPSLAWRPGVYHPPTACLEILTRGHFEWNAMLFRRNILSVVGGLDEELGEPLDFEFQLRVAARFPLAVSNHPCAVFVIGTANASQLIPVTRLARSFERMLDKFVTDPALATTDRERIISLMKRQFRAKLVARCLRAAAHGEAIPPSILDPFQDGWKKDRGFVAAIGLLNRGGAVSRGLFRAADRVRFTLKHGTARLRFRRMAALARTGLAPAPSAQFAKPTTPPV